MSFSADQFIQVKCKFQLTSETETSDSIFSHNERIRYCTSIDLDKDATIIVMVCSNESSNNHIVAYYIERKVQPSNTPSTDATSNNVKNEESKLAQQQNFNQISSSEAFVNPPQNQSQPQQQQQSSYPSRISNISTKARIIVKQIYYHNYNDDIVAICLSEGGNKLVLINASSTIYVIPLRNILLNLHLKQLRSSQAKSMYFYDASIIHCCSVDNPIAMACWESLENENKSTLVVANQIGQITFISVEEKRELTKIYIEDQIESLQIIKDMFSYSLLITCVNYNQYRFPLESIQLMKQQHLSNPQYEFRPHSVRAPIINRSNLNSANEDFICLKKDITVPCEDRKPIPINFNNNRTASRSKAVSIFYRVLSPIHRVEKQSGLSILDKSKEGSLPIILYCPTNEIISVVDTTLSPKPKSNEMRYLSPEPRMIRFYHSSHFYYKSQKPILVCKLSSLSFDETITHCIMTDRLIAVATNKDRCLISSKNCCNLRNSSLYVDLDPLVKEITFNSEEKILSLLKSPVSNDQDGIIDSFLLITNRSIYSIEARQNCRDMFINLIDTHLGIKPSLSGLPSYTAYQTSQNDYTLIDDFYTPYRKGSELNLLVTSFLCYRDEVYEKITYDSRAFSVLFKLELNSLYEAYGDKLLVRNQFELANRFLQMAKFDHAKILSKYFRLAAHKQSISDFEYFKFITAPEVVKVLVKDINLTCEHLVCLPQNMISFKKYSYVALSLFDSFRKLINIQNSSLGSPMEMNFSKQQRQVLENIFIEFLNVCLDESTDDSCRLWFNYINFYLNYVGNVDELETDILNLLNHNSVDCRLVITLYIAIGKGEDESIATGLFQMPKNVENHPIEPMEKQYNLSRLFKNEFLLKVLEKTLNLIPQSADINALSDCCWHFFTSKGLTKELYGTA